MTLDEYRAHVRAFLSRMGLEELAASWGDPEEARTTAGWATGRTPYRVAADLFTSAVPLFAAAGDARSRRNAS